MEKIGMQAVLEDKQFQDGAKRYTTTTNQMVATTEQASSEMTSAGNNMSSLANAAGVSSVAINALDTAMQGAAAVGAVMLIRGVVDAAMNLASLGTEATRVDDALARVAGAAGQSGDAIAAALGKAVQGTVDDEAMMQAATNSMIMGLKLTEQEWANLAAGAKYHARLIGKDTQSVFVGALEAIERGQPRMLTALKFPGARDAIAELSEELDGSASSMNEAERQGALLKLTMGLLADEMAKYGTMAPDLIDATDRFGVAWGNLKEEMGNAIVETTGVDEAMASIANTLSMVTETHKLHLDVLIRTGQYSMMAAVHTRELAGATHEEAVAAEQLNPELATMNRWLLETGNNAGMLTDIGDKLVQGIEAGTDRLTAMAAAYKALETAQGKLDDAIAKAAQRAVDAEEGAADKRRKAHADLMDALDKEEQDHAGKVEDLLQKIADVDADLQKEIVEAEAEAAQERIDIAQDMANSIAEAERKLAQEIEDLNRDRRYDDLDAEREYRQELEDIERDFKEQAADLEQERSDEEAAIREKYKEARIRELVAMGGDEATIRANWTDDMLQGPLKDAQDDELAALNEQYAKEQKELEDALAEKRRALEEEYTEEKAQRKLEYERRMEELQLQHARELEEIQRKNAEQLAALEQELAEEKTRLEAAAEEQRQNLRQQLADEEANHLEREAELQRHYDRQVAEISAALAEELAKIQRNLGLELIEITDNATATSQAWRDSFTQQLLDQDQYYVDRLARDALYQQQYQDLFGIHSPSKWAAEMGQALKSGLDIGLTTPALPAGGGSSVISNRTVNLSMPTTINNGMDAAAFRASVVQIIRQEIQYG